MKLSDVCKNSFAWCALLSLLLSACSDSNDTSSAPDAPIESAYYVDCSAQGPGAGTRSDPWVDLETVNSTVLEPGDHVLLRRGTVCDGMLKPIGMGSEENIIRIDAYDDGPLPIIDAKGVYPAAVYIEDISHLLIQNLELTNPGDINEDQSYRGVYLAPLERIVSHIEIRDLYIHDVTSRVEFCCGKRGGGIIADSKFDTTETQLDNILIENNLIEDVGRSGIYFDGSTAGSGERPRASDPWPAAGQNVVIRGNTLKRLQGDGIVAHGTAGALIEHNVVRAGNLAGMNWLSQERRNCAAGIWTWNSINTVIQYNEVTDYRFGQSETDGCDGTGYDIDNEQEGTIIQYNYSYNNEGGFILLCSDDETHTADVRYNLSVDDGKVLNVSPCKAPTIGTFDDIRIYNNTFVTSKPITALETIVLKGIGNAGNFEFANNIIYSTSPYPDPLPCGDLCTNNLFYNMPSSGTNALVGDPLFEDVSWRGHGRLEAGEAFKLRAGSPAINAGLTIDSQQIDYFGAEIPPNPAIGMHQPQ